LKTTKGVAFAALTAGRISLLGGVFWVIWYIGYNPDFYFGIGLPDVRFELWGLALSGIFSFVTLSGWIWKETLMWRRLYASFKGIESILWIVYWPKLLAPVTGVLPALNRSDFQLISWAFVGVVHLLFFLLFFFNAAKE